MPLKGRLKTGYDLGNHLLGARPKGVRLRDMSFHLRPAREADHGACRRMLPTAFPVVGRLPELLVAEEGGRIVGACAVAWVPRGFPILVHVEPCARRQGVGRALVATAATIAAGETDGLRPWGKVEEHSGGAAFLAACGFVEVGRLHVFELEPTRLRESIAALAERTRKRVHAAMRLVRPREAPRQQLLDLVGANLTTPRPFLEDALSGAGAHRYDQELSHVVMVEEAVAGAILAHRIADMLEVDLNVVDPAWRGGWVNLVLVNSVLQSGFEAGLTRLRFLAAPHVKNTINIAARGDGTRLPDLLTLVKPISTRP